MKTKAVRVLGFSPDPDHQCSPPRRYEFLRQNYGKPPPDKTKARLWVHQCSPPRRRKTDDEGVEAVPGIVPVTGLIVSTIHGGGWSAAGPSQPRGIWGIFICATRVRRCQLSPAGCRARGGWMGGGGLGTLPGRVDVLPPPPRASTPSKSKAASRSGFKARQLVMVAREGAPGRAVRFFREVGVFAGKDAPGGVHPDRCRAYGRPV